MHLDFFLAYENAFKKLQFEKENILNIVPCNFFAKSIKIIVKTVGGGGGRGIVSAQSKIMLTSLNNYFTNAPVLLMPWRPAR